MYADRKELSLESVTVHLSHEKVHANDGATCDREKGGRTKPKIDRIERVLELEGDLTEEQRTRLAEIADMCPVHQTLTSTTVVETRLA